MHRNEQYEDIVGYDFDVSVLLKAYLKLRIRRNVTTTASSWNFSLCKVIILPELGLPAPSTSLIPT